MEAIVFFIFSGLVLSGALGVVLFRHPVYSALSLVAAMISVAVLFLQQDADLVAIVQIVVYASAITVLFLFVIMLLGVDKREERDTSFKSARIVAVLLGILMLVGLGTIAGRELSTGTAPQTHPLTAPATDGVAPADEGNVEALAKVLFTDYIWAVEAVSVMLVIAVVGSVVLARRSRSGVARSSGEALA